MSSEYNDVLLEVGTDLALHDQLTASSARLHERMFGWQENRPDGMQSFEEALEACHGARVAKIHEYRKKGGKSIGTFCIYVPDEIALAADVMPLALCGGTGWSVDYADKMFPRDICPLVRSTFGMSFSGT